MEALRRNAVVGVKELVDEFLILFANVLFAVSLFAVWGL